MAHLLLEDSTDAGFLLEDGDGVLLLEDDDGMPPLPLRLFVQLIAGLLALFRSH